MKQMDLETLADFVLVATHGGLGKAARNTGRSKATLSRKVSDLEDALQVRLVERGATHLRLTPEGEALFARTRGLRTLPLGSVSVTSGWFADRLISAKKPRNEQKMRVAAHQLMISPRSSESNAVRRSLHI